MSFFEKIWQRNMEIAENKSKEELKRQMEESDSDDVVLVENQPPLKKTKCNTRNTKSKIKSSKGNTSKRKTTKPTKHNTRAVESEEEVPSIIILSDDELKEAEKSKDDLESYLNPPPPPPTVIIFVEMDNELHTIRLKPDEKLTKVFQELAAKTNFPLDRIRLELKERQELVFPEDTPESMGVGDYLMLKGFKSEDSLGFFSKDDLRFNNVDPSHIFTFHLLAKGDRKATIIKANKDSPLSELIQEYADLKAISPSVIKLCEDGDSIDPSLTPAQLDFEDGYQLDVLIQEA